jgi:hypothetical protein
MKSGKVRRRDEVRPVNSRKGALTIFVLLSAVVQIPAIPELV